jgi:chemotaxis protein methyltransferase WspC
VVAQAGGDERRAEEFFRKTIYLDPRHAEALAHLALLAEKNGDGRAARSLRQRAQRALEKETV